MNARVKIQCANGARVLSISSVYGMDDESEARREGETASCCKEGFK